MQIHEFTGSGKQSGVQKMEVQCLQLLSVLLRLELNQGQNPWDSNPAGVIRSCHSSVENGEGKCTCGSSVACLSSVQALTGGWGVIWKSRGWGISVLKSFCLFLLCSPNSFNSLYGKAGYVHRFIWGVLVIRHLLKCSVHLSNDFTNVISCMLCTQSSNLRVRPLYLLNWLQVCAWLHIVRVFFLFLLQKQTSLTSSQKQGSGCWLFTCNCSLLFFPLPPCQGSAVLQAASCEAGWEKDAVFLHLSPSWQLAVVG